MDLYGAELSLPLRQARTIFLSAWRLTAVIKDADTPYPVREGQRRAGEIAPLLQPTGEAVERRFVWAAPTPSSGPRSIRWSSRRKQTQRSTAAFVDTARLLRA
jgi:hypothetical protein